MGTNYYLTEKPPCECCGREYPNRHIGKSSIGWCFSLHVYPEDDINNLEDWKTLLQAGGCILDEYGTVISVARMLEIITDRVGSMDWKIRPMFYSCWKEFHDENSSFQGPNNLLRHRADGSFCVGNGEGTWDLLVGDFS